MPTTRSQSATPSTPPPHSRLALLPIVIPQFAGARSSSRTPAVHSHHRTTDEIALLEAAEILHSTPEALLHGDAGAEDLDGSARSLRHRRLNEARHLHPAEEVLAGEEMPEEGISLEETAKEHEPIGHIDDGPRLEEADEDQTRLRSVPRLDESLPDRLSRGPNMTVEAEKTVEEDWGDTDSPTETSDSESDSERTSETDEDSDEEDVRLEKLLQAARVSATKGSTTGKEDGIGSDGDEVVLQFGKGPEEAVRNEAPIPDISIPALPRPHLSFDRSGRAHAQTQTPSAGPSRQRPPDKAPAPELDDRPYERELSKKEKAAQPRKATPSNLWSTLPKPKSDLLPQMKRDYQALSLATSLDPKRFMKGGNKAGKIPEVFAIGRLIEPPRHLQDTTVTREARYRPGQVVEGLVRDEGVGEYAKRKYGDLQHGRMENGRGKGWKKRTKW